MSRKRTELKDLDPPGDIGYPVFEGAAMLPALGASYVLVGVTRPAPGVEIEVQPTLPANE